MQRHTLVINNRFSATTVGINSGLQDYGDYVVNYVQGLGGEVVNASNVRGFLNDDANENVINDFFSYLTASTTTIEFAEIYNSNQNLANTFNNYYNSSVLQDTLPSTSVIDQSLSGTYEIEIIYNSDFNYLSSQAQRQSLSGIPLSINGEIRELDVYSALTTYTLEESYYVPVFIKRNNLQFERNTVEYNSFLNNITSSTVSDTVVNSGTTILFSSTTNFYY